MNTFKKLFGLDPSLIKKTCIILPSLKKGFLPSFGVEALTKGHLYGCGNADAFTLIQTGISAAFAGDAVLYLKETPCEQVLLFGSCGSTGGASGLEVGDLVLPYCCYAQESFSRMLLEPEAKLESFSPDKGLLTLFSRLVEKEGIKKAACLTVASLKLEEERVVTYRQKGLDLLDMESSAFLAAAHHCGLKALAFFYVTDVVAQTPFYADLDEITSKRIDASVKKAISLLCAFTRENLRG